MGGDKVDEGVAVGVWAAQRPHLSLLLPYHDPDTLGGGANQNLRKLVKS